MSDTTLGGILMKDMIVHDACVGNLNHVSLTLPKNKLIVFTGVSGSGKSTLAKDVIYMETQRQYLEAINLQGIPKPNIAYMKNTSPSILITQHSYQKNPRSTLGTLTNIYTDFRMIYEKIGKRTCTSCGNLINPSTCIEEVEKHGNDYEVFLYCPHCNQRIPAFTRSHFSYNTREGACPACSGLGTKLSYRLEAILDDTKPLQDGGVRFFEKRYAQYQSDNFFKALEHYHISCPKDTLLKDYTEAQKALLLYGVKSEQVDQLFPHFPIPKKANDGMFEGVLPILMRRVSQKGGIRGALKEYFYDEVCDTCHGERLHEKSRNVHVCGTRLPQLSNLTLEELKKWLQQLVDTIDKTQYHIIKDYVLDSHTKIDRLVRLGLGYLSLERQAMTLSGGESQRVKLAAVLDSEVTGILYILDEPTIGLHTKDTQGILQILKELRDRENTLIVIEHDINLIKEADEIVELGPFAGNYGGEIVAQGSWKEMMANEKSLLSKHASFLSQPQHSRHASSFITIHDAYLHNLKHIDVSIPLGVLTCVTGVSGSGKSTLIFEVLAKSTLTPTGCKKIVGLEQIDEIITISQSEILRTRRSNIATYTSLFDAVRKLYGNHPNAKQKGLQPKHFSFNVEAGRCEACAGLGYVVSNMLFFEDVEVPCPVCHGQRFQEEVLLVKVNGKNILEVLQMSVEEASIHFKEYTPILKVLDLLKEVGLQYVTLGQSLTTLSGGEVQRLKLANELLEKKNKHTLYLIDEPTTGLHPYDILHFTKLIQRLVDEGNSVVIVEHNMQLITQADWIIDMGKEGGTHGGSIVVQGTLADIKTCSSSYTGLYLRKEGN